LLAVKPGWVLWRNKYEHVTHLSTSKLVNLTLCFLTGPKTWGGFWNFNLSVIYSLAITRILVWYNLVIWVYVAIVQLFELNN
jgi:hypothetical protein